MKKSINNFIFDIEYRGYSIFESIVERNLINRLRSDLEKHIKNCEDIQRKNGLKSGFSGVAHHTIGEDDSFDDFINNFFLDEYITAYFQGPYIINSFNAINNMSNSSDYKHAFNFHRDIRTYSGNFRLLLNCLVMLDDFTVENGATKLIPGSHRFKEKPSDEYAEKNSVRATANAGSIVLFDSNLWHSAAINLTEFPRRALTLTFSRPYFKQQIDFPRLLGDTYPKDEKMKQLLGYNARVPSSRDEWYQPPDKFFYKKDQG